MTRKSRSLLRFIAIASLLATVVGCVDPDPGVNLPVTSVGAWKYDATTKAITIDVKPDLTALSSRHYIRYAHVNVPEPDKRLSFTLVAYPDFAPILRPVWVEARGRVEPGRYEVVSTSLFSSPASSTVFGTLDTSKKAGELEKKSD